jgi:hypothetical protein
MSQTKWNTKCGGKIVKHGAKGFTIGKANSEKQKSFCSRSLGIAKKFPSAREPCSKNYLSRRRWRCKIEEIEK